VSTNETSPSPPLPYKKILFADSQPLSKISIPGGKVKRFMLMVLIE